MTLRGPQRRVPGPPREASGLRGDVTLPASCQSGRGGGAAARGGAELRAAAAPQPEQERARQLGAGSERRLAKHPRPGLYFTSAQGSRLVCCRPA